MPKHARLDAPGAVDHLIVRGITRSAIFYDDIDRDRFIDRALKEQSLPPVGPRIPVSTLTDSVSRESTKHRVVIEVPVVLVVAPTVGAKTFILWIPILTPATRLSEAVKEWSIAFSCHSRESGWSGAGSNPDGGGTSSDFKELQSRWTPVPDRGIRGQAFTGVTIISQLLMGRVNRQWLDSGYVLSQFSDKTDTARIIGHLWKRG